MLDRSQLPATYKIAVSPLMVRVYARRARPVAVSRLIPTSYVNSSEQTLCQKYFIYFQKNRPKSQNMCGERRKNAVIYIEDIYNKLWETLENY